MARQKFFLGPAPKKVCPPLLYISITVYISEGVVKQIAGSKHRF